MSSTGGQKSEARSQERSRLYGLSDDFARFQFSLNRKSLGCFGQLLNLNPRMELHKYWHENSHKLAFVVMGITWEKNSLNKICFL